MSTSNGGVNTRRWRGASYAITSLVVFLVISATIAGSRDITAQAQVGSPVTIGIDAEFGLPDSTSAQSIEYGVRVAVEEINTAGGVLGGRPLQVVTRDNRSMPARGVRNLEELAKIPNLVAVISGRFSPVVIETIPHLPQLQLINLAPWSAADAITDNGQTPNWSFRLSLRDSYAMPAMLRHAAASGSERVGLLLTNTSWGRSNAKAAETYQNQTPKPKVVHTAWYNWGDKTLIEKYQSLRAAGAQAVIMVTNDDDAAILVSEVAALPPNERLPLISHWGITGGNFVRQLGDPQALDRVNLTVVQTFSLFRADPARVSRILAVTKRLFGIDRIEQIAAPVGFGQAYDLIHILARAIDAAGSTDRIAIRDRLEQITDHQGLVRQFPQPFSPTRHDALDPEDVFMAHIRRDGVIIPLSSPAH